jgi:hypothetical protein
MTIALDRNAKTTIAPPSAQTPLAVATRLAQHLSQQVQERDEIAGIPQIEAQLLRESGLLPLVVYWRNLRTLSLHDPVDYKRFGIGNWVVNGISPLPSSYA